MPGHDGELVVHYASLEETSTDISKVATNLSQQLEHMGQATVAVAEGWEGEAFQAMQDAQKQFQQAGHRIQTALSQVSQRVTEAKTQFHGSDKKAASYFMGG